MTGPRLPRPRRALARLEPYIPGRSAEEVMARYGVSRVAKLGSNENPLGAPPGLRAAVLRAAERANHYPDPSCAGLRRRLGERLGLPADHFCVANGADNVLTCIGLAFLDPGDRCVVARPTYTAYAALADLLGAGTEEVPLRDWRIDVEAMAQAARGAKALFVCNPNNPTGTIVRSDEANALLERVAPDVLVVLDEAYAEWADDASFPDAVALLRRHANVMVLRTFSKIYGLAGMRVGYAAAAAPLIAYLNQVREPFPVSRLSQAAAEAVLDDEDYVRASFENNRRGKAFLAAAFERLGLRYVPSQANFMLVEFGRPAAAVAELLARRGVIIRPGAMWGLPTWARISVGTPDENRDVAEALAAVLREPA